MNIIEENRSEIQKEIETQISNRIDIQKLVLNLAEKGLITKYKEDFHVVIAGASVSNIILNFIHKLNAPINDIDMYYLQNNSLLLHERHKLTSDCPLPQGFVNLPVRYSDKLEQKGLEDLLLKAKSAINPSHYVCTKRSMKDKSILYKINKVSKIDNIDLIFGEYYYSWGHLPVEERKKYLTQLVLEGFDINAVKAGIPLKIEFNRDKGSNNYSLKFGEFTFISEFNNFINNMDLEVVNPATPIHTAYRLLKKQNELSCYLDKETELSLLKETLHYNFMSADSDIFSYNGDDIYKYYIKQFRKEFYRHNIDTNILVDRFGKKLHDNIKGYEDEIGKYFHIQEYIPDKIWRVFPHNVQIYSNKKERFTLTKLFSQTQIIENNPVRFVYHARELFKNKNNFSKYEKLYRGLPNDLIEYIFDKTIEEKDFVRKYVQQEVSELKFKKYLKFLQKHKSLFLFKEGILYNFLVKSKSLYSSINNYSIIDRYIKKYPPLIGALESGTYSTEWDSISIDTVIKNLVNDIKKDWDSHLKNNLLYFGDFDYNKEITIKELNTKGELYTEGKSMNHCVGGYFNRLKNNEDRIFSLKYEKDRSTLHIRKNRSGGWAIVQNYSMGNSRPNIELVEYSAKLIEFLNDRDSVEKEDSEDLFECNFDIF